MQSISQSVKQLIWGKQDILFIDQIFSLYKGLVDKVQRSSDEIVFDEDWVDKLNKCQQTTQGFPSIQEFVKLLIRQDQQMSCEESDDDSDEDQEFEDALQELNDDDDHFVDSLDHFEDYVQIQELDQIHIEYEGWDQSESSQNIINFGVVTSQFIEYFCPLFEMDEMMKSQFVNQIYNNYSNLIFNCRKCGYNELRFCKNCQDVKKLVIGILNYLEREYIIDPIQILMADQSDFQSKIEYLKQIRVDNFQSYKKELEDQLQKLKLPIFLSFQLLLTHIEIIDGKIVEVFKMREPSYFDYLKRPLEEGLQQYQQGVNDFSNLLINSSYELTLGAQKFVQLYIQQVEAQPVVNNQQFFQQVYPNLLNNAYKLVGEYSSTIVTLTDNMWYEVEQFKHEPQSIILQGTDKKVIPIEIMRSGDQSNIQVMFRQMINRIRIVSETKEIKQLKGQVSDKFCIQKLVSNVKASRIVNICVDDILDGMQAQRWGYVSSEEQECFYVQWCSKQSTLDWIKNILITEIQSLVKANFQKFVGNFFVNSNVRIDYLFQLDKKLKLMGRFLDKVQSAYDYSYFSAQGSGILLAHLINTYNLFQGAKLNFFCQSMGSVLVQSCITELMKQGQIEMVGSVYVLNGMESRKLWNSQLLKGLQGKLYNLYNPQNWRMMIYKHTNQQVKDPSGLEQISPSLSKVLNFNLQKKTGMAIEEIIKDLLLKGRFSYIFE